MKEAGTNPSLDPSSAMTHRAHFVIHRGCEFATLIHTPGALHVAPQAGPSYESQREDQQNPRHCLGLVSMVEEA